MNDVGDGTRTGDEGTRSALVTGGAGGLGMATVRRLVEGGVPTVAFDRVDGGQALVDDSGDTVVTVSGNVLDDRDVIRAIETAQHLGRLSVLVNVAGGVIGGGPTVSDDGSPHDARSFARTMEINAIGTWNSTRLTAAAMAENEPDGRGERGVIINTASIAGFEGQRGQVAYAAAKAAILGMTLPLARDLAPSGIRVCAIAPATMATPAVLGLLDCLDGDPTKYLVFPDRLGNPDEFAELVESIVANGYLNGENIRLDGAVRLAGS